MDIIVQIISILVQHETSPREINMRLVLYWLTFTVVFTCYALRVLWLDSTRISTAELHERNNELERQVNELHEQNNELELQANKIINRIRDRGNDAE